MLNKLTILSLFTITLFFGKAHTQNEESKYNCDLQKDNKLWLSKYIAAKSNSEKIELIKSKVISDFQYTTFKPEHIIRDQERNNQNINSDKELCGCKNLVVVFYSKRKKIFLNNYKPSTTRRLFELINEITVNRIQSIENLPKYQNEYCQHFIIYTKDKRIKREIKHIEKLN